MVEVWLNLIQVLFGYFRLMCVFKILFLFYLVASVGCLLVAFTSGLGSLLLFLVLIYSCGSLKQTDLTLG